MNPIPELWRWAYLSRIVGVDLTPSGTGTKERSIRLIASDGTSRCASQAQIDEAFEFGLNRPGQEFAIARLRKAIRVHVESHYAQQSMAECFKVVIDSSAWYGEYVAIPEPARPPKKPSEALLWLEGCGILRGMEMVCRELATPQVKLTNLAGKTLVVTHSEAAELLEPVIARDGVAKLKPAAVQQLIAWRAWEKQHAADLGELRRLCKKLGAPVPAEVAA